MPEENQEIDATGAAIALAVKHGIDLATVKGSGDNGRILKKDIVDIIEAGPQEVVTPEPPQEEVTPTLPQEEAPTTPSPTIPILEPQEVIAPEEIVTEVAIPVETEAPTKQARFVDGNGGMSRKKNIIYR
jgi:pyruvate dehydrogenase E2 component (dihydrolipoamide acetyltransferase)